RVCSAAIRRVRTLIGLSREVPIGSVQIAAGLWNLGNSLFTPEGGAAVHYEELRRILGSSPRRVVVIVEDLDRLPEPDVVSMFSLVKAVADFPMTSYLLAYDHGQIARALDEI